MMTLLFGGLRTTADARIMLEGTPPLKLPSSVVWRDDRNHPRGVIGMRYSPRNE